MGGTSAQSGVSSGLRPPPTMNIDMAAGKESGKGPASSLGPPPTVNWYGGGQRVPRGALLRHLARHQQQGWYGGGQRVRKGPLPRHLARHHTSILLVAGQVTRRRGLPLPTYPGVYAPCTPLGIYTSLYTPGYTTVPPYPAWLPAHGAATYGEAQGGPGLRLGRIPWVRGL